jgi:hypothetical protein
VFNRRASPDQNEEGPRTWLRNVEYHHFNSAVIHAAVAPDGKFSGSAPSSYMGGRNVPLILTITGQITGGGIAAKASLSSFCGYAMALKKFL